MKQYQTPDKQQECEELWQRRKRVAMQLLSITCINKDKLTTIDFSILRIGSGE